MVFIVILIFIKTRNEAHFKINDIYFNYLFVLEKKEIKSKLACWVRYILIFWKINFRLFFPVTGSTVKAFLQS